LGKILNFKTIFTSILRAHSLSDLGEERRFGLFTGKMWGKGWNTNRSGNSVVENVWRRERSNLFFFQNVPHVLNFKWRSKEA